MPEKICDFALQHVSNTYDRNGDKLLVHVNWKTDADIDVYGAVFGTLIVEHDMKNPNAKSGACRWQVETFMADGTRVMGWQEGTWETTDEHTWALKMEGWDSLSGDLRTESEMKLETLRWEGAVYKR